MLPGRRSTLAFGGLELLTESIYLGMGPILNSANVGLQLSALGCGCGSGTLRFGQRLPEAGVQGVASHSQVLNPSFEFSPLPVQIGDPLVTDGERLPHPFSGCNGRLPGALRCLGSRALPLDRDLHSLPFLSQSGALWGHDRFRVRLTRLQSCTPKGGRGIHDRCWRVWYGSRATLCGQSLAKTLPPDIKHAGECVR
ncbi:MAG: hypothetical protein ABS96_09050 [Lysobacteraceae bacterium SCN 69-123]|nr:MAG: hypothetical protein ABS96_09050 [Xanthomonadaceae bacterium SCN 69-123]